MTGILEESGRTLYQSLPAYRDMANVLEHPLFRSFYMEYLSDPVTCDAMLLHMHLYMSIGNRVSTGYQKLAVVHHLLSDRRTRGAIVHGSKPSLDYDQGQTGDE